MTPKQVRRYSAYCAGLNAQGTTVILITHDNGIAAKAKRIVRLIDGRIVSDSPNTPDEARALNENM